MTGRSAAVRNRLLVAVAAVLLAWLFGWTSDAGLALIVIAVVALALAVMRGAFGGLPVLANWLVRYRRLDVGLRQLGDIIGEHEDDMRRAGLVVSPGLRRPSLMMSMTRRRHYRPRPAPDLIPRLRHAPYDGGIVVSLQAVRAGMSQEEILEALPRLRSAWGVDEVDAKARPGGRVVDFRIPLTDDAMRAAAKESTDGHEPREQEHRSEPGASRPPDEPPVTVVGGREQRTETISRTRPPRIQPQLEPDERGRYELTMLPEDAARTFAPRTTEQSDDDANPSTAEIPVIEAPTHIPVRTPARKQPARTPEVNGGERRNPTDLDERDLRLGPHWRTGKER